MRWYIEAVARACVGVAILLWVTLMAIALTSCSKIDHIGNVGKGILVDCTKSEIVKTTNELGPLVEELLYDSVDGEGHVDWSPVRSAAKRWSMELGGCVAAEVVARVLTSKPNDPAAPKLATVQLNREELRQGFAQLKAEFFGGIDFVTASGMKL